MNPYLITAIALIVIYLVVNYALFGLLHSISATEKKVGIIFSIWCVAVGTLLFIALYKTAPLVVFPAFGFWVVGFSPKYYEKWQKGIHYYGALFIIAGGCAMVIFQFNVFLGLLATAMITAFSLVAHLYNLKRKILWIELLAIVLILGIVSFPEQLFSLIFNTYLP